MQLSKGRILCTEDDSDSRELISIVLKRAGYDVIGTDSPAEAIKRVRTETFDLILVDNWMPELSGGELTRAIRTFNQSTPILFYSAAAFESDKQNAREAGAQGYLVKPTGISQLVDEVGRLIIEARIALPMAIELPNSSN